MSQITCSYLKFGCLIGDFPPFCKSDLSKYGYLEVFQRVPSISRYRELTVGMFIQRLKRNYPRIFISGALPYMCFEFASSISFLHFSLLSCQNMSIRSLSRCLMSIFSLFFSFFFISPVLNLREKNNLV